MGRAAAEIVDVQFQPVTLLNESGFWFLVGRSPPEFFLAGYGRDSLILIFAFAAKG